MPHTPAMMNRRQLLSGVALLALPAAISPTPALAYPVQHTDAEWRKLLPAPAYAVLRQKSTEAPFTSPLLNEHRKGVFACAADGLPLFASATKYDSGTGWPSFWQPLPGAIGTSTDHEIGYARTEVHCARCGGHLGHVFDDGPRPTGLRYCMNGVALQFAAGAA